MTVLDRLQELQRHRELYPELSKTELAKVVGLRRESVSRYLAIANALEPETVTLLKHHRWAGFKLLSALTELTGQDQISTAQRLIELAPPTEVQALAEIGIRSTSQSPGHRIQALYAALDARSRHEVKDRVVVVVAEMVRAPGITPGELKQRGHSLESITEAEKFVKTLSASVQSSLSPPIPSGVLRWFSEELHRRFPESAAQLGERGIETLVRRGGGDRKRLEDALQIAEHPINKDSRWNEPISIMNAVLKAMSPPALKRAATISRQGGYPEPQGFLPDSWIPSQHKSPKVRKHDAL